MRHLTVENCTLFIGLKAKLKSNSLIIFALSIARLSEPCIQQLNQCLVQLQSKTHCMCFCGFKSGHIFHVFYFDIRLNSNSISTKLCFGGISFLVDKILTMIDACNKHQRWKSIQENPVCRHTLSLKALHCH